jgi:hypothetical protein
MLLIYSGNSREDLERPVTAAHRDELALDIGGYFGLLLYSDTVITFLLSLHTYMCIYIKSYYDIIILEHNAS